MRIDLSIDYKKEVLSAIELLLTEIGEDPKREGLLETPHRIIKSWQQLFSGYKYREDDIQKMMTCFTNDNKYDEIVLLKDIELFSTCEHHWLPFTGKAHIAYIPNKKIVGISKLARLLEVYSRRLQIQERIGEQVTNFLMNNFKARGAACIIEAQHLCIKARGIQKQNSMMVTSSLKGVFMTKPEARHELMSLIK